AGAGGVDPGGLAAAVPWAGEAGDGGREGGGTPGPDGDTTVGMGRVVEMASEAVDTVLPGRDPGGPASLAAGGVTGVGGGDGTGAGGVGGAGFAGAGLAAAFAGAPA